MTHPGSHPSNLSQTPPAESPICADGNGLSLCMLASGSKGNSIYISSGQTAILFDAGLSGKEIERRMKCRGLRPQELDAIVVSHEHGDHIQGVGIMARRFGLPVYIAPETLEAAHSHLGQIQPVHGFACGTAFSINDLSIRPFSVSHDAAAPAGFTIENHAGKIGLATDLGIATAMVKHHLQDCSLLVLEANHDPHLLETGPYPWPVKQRVKSRTGHLSNESARALLMELLHDRLAHVVLAHISETNNTPEQALQVVTGQLGRHPVQFSIACQDRCGDLISLP